MARKIESSNPTPKYQQLASIIRQKIENGEWESRSPIQSESQLEQEYEISRTTVRQAIDFLILAGYLYRKHGKGTFVAPEELRMRMLEMNGFSEDFKKRGITPGQIIRSFSREIPPAKIQKMLDLKPDRTVLKIVRIRLGNGKPIGIQTSYDALTEDQHVTKSDLDSSGSIYKILFDRFNIVIAEADETFEATLATPEEAKFLQIKRNSPLLLDERFGYTQDRKPFEYVKTIFRGDKYQFNFHLKRYES